MCDTYTWQRRSLIITDKAILSLEMMLHKDYNRKCSPTNNTNRISHFPVSSAVITFICAIRKKHLVVTVDLARSRESWQASSHHAGARAAALASYTANNHGTQHGRRFRNAERSTEPYWHVHDNHRQGAPSHHTEKAVHSANIVNTVSTLAVAHWGSYSHRLKSVSSSDLMRVILNLVHFSSTMSHNNTDPVIMTAYVV
jgi:hypothetical protein